MATREVIQVEQRVPFLKGLPLSFQHLFAMFGASILVPMLFNTAANTTVVDPALVLMMNGIGTLIYIFICHGKVPDFLGSSFAFIAPTITCMQLASSPELGFRHALGGFIAAGAIFAIIATIIKLVGKEWLNIVLPPAAMGAIVALIGLELAPVAANMAFYSNGCLSTTSIIISTTTLLVVVIGSLSFRGFFATIPILISVLVGYAVAAIINIWVPGTLDFSSIHNSNFLTIPKLVTPVFHWSSILIILPASLVVVSEHIGHLFVTSNIVGRDLLKDPGLHKTLLGDGVSTMLSGLCGSCPTTTYSENMGVMAITKVYSVWIVGGAGLISIIIAFLGKISGAIRSLPVPVIGGVSMMLFGVIASSGLRIILEAKVDYSKSRNLLLTAIVFIVGNSKVAISIGHTQLTGMVLATIVAIGFSLLLHIFDKLHLTNEASDTLPVTKETAKDATTCSE